MVRIMIRVRVRVSVMARLGSGYDRVRVMVGLASGRDLCSGLW